MKRLLNHLFASAVLFACVFSSGCIATVATDKLIESSRGPWLRNHVESVEDVWREGDTALIHWRGAMSWADWETSRRVPPPEAKDYWAEFSLALESPGGGRLVSKGARIAAEDVHEGPLPPERREWATYVPLYDWRGAKPTPEDIEEEKLALEEFGATARATFAPIAALSSARLATIRLRDGQSVASVNVGVGAARGPTRLTQYPARVIGYGLLPVAIAFDVVTSPIQYFIWAPFYDPSSGKAPFGLGSESGT